MPQPRRSTTGRLAHVLLRVDRGAPLRPRAWAALLAGLMTAVPALAFAQQQPQPHAPAQPDSLAPFFLLAVAIERFWETVFSVVEGGMVTTGRLLGSVAGPLRSIEAELAASRREVAELSKKLVGKPVADPAYAAVQREIVRAEQRLERARGRVALVTRDPAYISLKRSVILVGSLVLGPVVARASGLQLFHALGVPGMNAGFDELLTGLIIGTGSEPTHNLLGALGGLRAALCSLAELPRKLTSGAAARAQDDAREDDDGREDETAPAAPPAQPRGEG